MSKHGKLVTLSTDHRRLLREQQQVDPAVSYGKI